MSGRPPSIYSRLTRSRSGVGTYTSLWLASNHVMQLTSTGYTESYRRFYLKDIQAIFLVRTERRLHWHLVWGAIFGLGLLIALENGGSALVYTIILAFGAVTISWNHLLGPACYGVVVTAVQTDRIPSLARVNRSQKVVARLRPLIEAAQADLGQPSSNAAGPAAVSAAPDVPPPLEPA
jgi:hypothetical protein